MYLVKGATNASTGQPQYEGIDLHSSSYNNAITIVWGQRRVTPNVIWCANVNLGSSGWMGTGLQISAADVFKGPLDVPVVSGPSGTQFTNEIQQQVIPTGTPTIIAPPSTFLPTGYSFSENVFVRYSGTTSQLQEVSSSPTAGQYTVSVSAGVATYTFATADEGNFVDIFYTVYLASGSGQTNFPDSWWMPIVAALCEGPVDAILHAWDGTNPLALGSVDYGVELVNGTSTQPVWSGWAASGQNRNLRYPTAALMAYRNTAYLVSWTWRCGDGDNSVIPQQSFECVRHPGGSAHANPNGSGDYLLSFCLEDLLTNPIYGVGFYVGGER